MKIEVGNPRIAREAEQPGVYRGAIEFYASQALGDVEITQEVAVRVRFAHEAGATYEALEAALLKEAARLLSQAAQRATEGR